MGFFDFVSNDIGIDLGTANTLVFVRGQGIVLNEPSVVAVEKASGKILAVGSAAKEMLGRTPGEISAIRPLKDGVIADFEISEKLLSDFIRRVIRHKYLIKPRIVISVPSGITEVEKRAVRDSAENAGAREVYLLSEPMAAAIGVGLPVDQPSGIMVIDIGGGTSEIAVIALNGIVHHTSVRIAGDELNDAIVMYLKKNYNL
ncbi:MAG: rod shape-determining protein MreB, partial [candidate division Zixibacteria bacterium]|nr:rod shape-determining protein MreB [candidate division Zixibacteria bacterium]